MDQTQMEAIEAKTFNWLQRAHFASTSLVPVSGGTVNFAFLVHLKEALEDGIECVFVKHSEEFVRHTPSFRVSLSRVRHEFECIKSLSDLKLHSQENEKNSPDGKPVKFSVRTPRGLHLDEANGMQIHEYIPNCVDLKTYLLSGISKSTANDYQSHYVNLGKLLGQWTRKFHDDTVRQPVLAEIIGKNNEAQQVKQHINYQFAIDRVEQYPTILTDVKTILEDIRDMASREIGDGTLRVIHGDFNPSNVLITDSAIQAGDIIQMFVVDWEVAHQGVPNLDVGQMIAELYQLSLCHTVKAGLWMAQGFCDGYGPVSEEFALRTAIHAGVHLLAIGTLDKGLDSPHRVKEVIKAGRNVIVEGYNKNKLGIEETVFACLFRQVTKSG